MEPEETGNIRWRAFHRYGIVNSRVVWLPGLPDERDDMQPLRDLMEEAEDGRLR